MENTDIKPPKSPLTAKVWSTLYANTPIDAQVELLREIMINLNISFIKAGDTVPDKGFVWMTNSHWTIGSLSSNLINSLGFMHSFKHINERCSVIVKAIMKRGEYEVRAPDCRSVYSICAGNILNSVEEKKDLLSIFYIPELFTIRISSDDGANATRVYIKDIIDDDDLFKKFVECWKPDEELQETQRNIPYAPLNLDYNPEDDYTEEQRRSDARHDLVGDCFNEMNDILRYDDDCFNLFIEDIRILIKKYKKE